MSVHVHARTARTRTDVHGHLPVPGHTYGFCHAANGFTRIAAIVSTVRITSREKQDECVEWEPDRLSHASSLHKISTRVKSTYLDAEI